MKELIKAYFQNESDISSRRVNVFIFIVFYIAIACIALFTKWVKSEHIFDVITDACMFIIVGYTLGISATDVFRRKPEKPQPAPEPDPVRPEPDPKPEPVSPQPDVTPVTEPKKKSDVDPVDIEFIKKHEGVKLDAYLCPGRVWTLGAGSTMHPDGRKVRKGDRITPQQVDEYLRHEVKIRLEQMQLPEWMNRNQRTAVLSWQYNCGQAAWMKSELRRLILAKAHPDRVKLVWMSRYITAAGKQLPGLVKRRREEAELFYKPM